MNPIHVSKPSTSDPLSNLLYENPLSLTPNSKDLKHKTFERLKALDGKMRMMEIPDNVSYKSFLPDKFAPVGILSSSEDPLLVHRNIVSSMFKGANLFLLNLMIIISIGMI